MYCPQCGAKNSETARYCEECGSRLPQKNISARAPEGYRRRAQETGFDENISLDKQVKKQKEVSLQEKASQQPFYQPDSNESQRYRRYMDSVEGLEEKNVSMETEEEEAYGEEYIRKTERPQRTRRQTPPRKKKKRKNTTLAAFVIAECILAVGLLAGFVFLGQKYSSPETAAEKYWTALKDKDWCLVYEMLDLPKSSALSKQAFVNAHRDDMIMESYTDPKIREDASQAADTLAAGRETKGIRVDYQGSDGAKTDTFTLVKSDEKRLLFFPKWMVDAKDYLVENVAINVSEGAKVTLDGNLAADSEGQTQILFPYLFAGTYQLSVSGEGMKEYREVRQFQDNDTLNISLTPETGADTSLVEKAGTDLQKILQAALTDKDFGSVSEYFSQDALNNGTVKADYNALRQLSTNGNKEGVFLLEIKNLQGSVKNDGSGNTTVSLTGNAVKNYIVKNPEGEGFINQSKENQISLTAVYTRQASGWRLSQIPITADQINGI